MGTKGIVLEEIRNNFLEVAREIRSSPSQNQYFTHPLCKFSKEQVIGPHAFPNWLSLVRVAGFKLEPKDEPYEPKILVIDIENAPMKAYLWAMYDQSVSPNQVINHKYLLSYSAKWLGEKKMFYRDQRDSPDIENDKELVKEVFGLLNEADVVVGQNSKRFDTRVLNARIQKHRLGIPSPYKQDDTKLIAKKHFDLPSYSLEYMSEFFGLKNRKTKSRKFIGFDLWLQCMAGNKAAFKEMEAYNRLDVLATEELYLLIKPWGSAVDLNPMRGEAAFRCQCGSRNLKKEGFHYTKTGKFQQYSCRDCGSWMSDKVNLLSERKRLSLKGP
jgi:DNA polymerase III epsilon subunit-like protein